jgi:RNA polymerase sigma factor (sigma-70 family)
MGDWFQRREKLNAEESRQMDAIVSAHESALLRYAVGIVNCPHAAQDIVQNAFIKLFRQWKPGMQPTPAIRGWLYRVTHNEAIDHLRRESRIKLLHLGHAKEEASLPRTDNPGHDRVEQMEMVLNNLRRLQPAERQVILLRLQEGLSYEEISRITGRTTGNVGCLLHHAVKKLHRIVQECGAESRG